LFNKFVDFDKEYVSTLTLGLTTSTGDIEGRIISETASAQICQEDLIKVFGDFIGEKQQIPPMVSALRFKGKRLYQLARQGIDVARQPRKIRIDKLELLNFNPPDVEFYVKCSKGTYVRRLAEEIGEKLNCGGCISRIRRVSLGPFNVKDAINLNNLHESYIRPWKG
jgi:tRNA pseudouridine55 synthase